MHISSLLVHANPASAAQLRADLTAIPGVELHAVKEDHTFVVTIETDSEQQSADAFTQIGRMDGVLSTSLVYHQIETEPEQEI